MQKRVFCSPYTSILIPSLWFGLLTFKGSLEICVQNLFNLLPLELILYILILFSSPVFQGVRVGYNLSVTFPHQDPIFERAIGLMMTLYYDPNPTLTNLNPLEHKMDAESNQDHYV